MSLIISGIQSLGVGVPDIQRAWDWYGKNLGFTVPVYDAEMRTDLMKAYTGGAQAGHAVLALNMQGGGGLAFWQYTSREAKAPAFEVKAGDIGIYAARIKTSDINKAYESLRGRGASVSGSITAIPDGTKCFYLRDVNNNVIRIEESKESFMRTKAAAGGLIGAVIGVSNMERSINFYREVLGYDKLIYDVKGQFLDLPALPGGDGSFRRVMLGTSEKGLGSFGRFLGSSGVELIQALGHKPDRILRNRSWGDSGFIHLCFNVQGISGLRKYCSHKGYKLTVDSSGSGVFKIDRAAGNFAFIEDPDGNLIKFAEAVKIPLIRTLGLNLNLKNTSREKPLPDWLLKMMRLNAKRF